MNKEKEIFVSVVTVSYNSSKYLKSCIDSVLSSSFSHFEYIISDDASSDDSWAIIDSYSDNRMVKFRQKSNIGEYPNRNFCINQAKGKYLIFIDGDDILYSDGLNYIYNSAKDFDDISMIIGLPWDEQIIYPYKISNIDYIKSIFLGLHSYAPLNFTKVAYNIKYLKEKGSLSTKYKIGDTYIQLLLGSDYPALLINDCFAWWRRREGQASHFILKNGVASAESFNFSEIYLKSAQCILKGAELENARKNLYGVFSRMLVREIFKFKFKKFRMILNISGFPKVGWKYITQRSNRYFSITNVH